MYFGDADGDVRDGCLVSRVVAGGERFTGVGTDVVDEKVRSPTSSAIC